jgi:hypothetical protein
MRQNSNAQATQRNTNAEYAFPQNGGAAPDDDIIPPPYQREAPGFPMEPQIQPPDYSEPEEQTSSATIPLIHSTDCSMPEDSSPVSHIR